MTNKVKLEVLDELINRFAESKKPHESDYLYNTLREIRADYKKVAGGGVETKIVSEAIDGMYTLGFFDKCMFVSSKVRKGLLKCGDRVKVILLKVD